MLHEIAAMLQNSHIAVSLAHEKGQFVSKLLIIVAYMGVFGV